MSAGGVFGCRGGGPIAPGGRTRPSSRAERRPCHGPRRFTYWHTTRGTASHTPEAPRSYEAETAEEGL